MFYSTVVLVLLEILESTTIDGGIFILFFGDAIMTYIKDKLTK